MTLMEMLKQYKQKRDLIDPENLELAQEILAWILDLMEYEEQSWGDDWEANITARMFFRKELDLL